MARAPMGTQIDLKRMRYVVEVARAEGFTAAARALAISQPALTRNIAEVEDALGVQLFHRLPRGIELTDEGREFVARARQVLADVDGLVDHIRQESGPRSGRLRIGVTPAGYSGYLRDAVSCLAERHPGVAVEVHTGSTQLICPRLLHGEFQRVVGSSSYLERWAELEVRRLKPMRFACMVRKRHPLAQVTELEETDVLQYPVIMSASVEAMHSDLSARAVANDLPPLQPRYVTDDFDLIMRLVRESDAFHPVMAPEETIVQLEKQFLMLRDAVRVPTHYISIAHARHRPETSLGRLFEEILIDVL